MAKSQELLAMEQNSHLTKAEMEQKINSTVKVEVKKELIIAPSYLNAKMKSRFNDFALELQEAKIFTHLEIDILGQYCYNLITYEKLSKKMLKIEITSEKYFELAKLQKQLSVQMKDESKELGIGFFSRSKMQLPTKNKSKESKFKKLDRRKDA